MTKTLYIDRIEASKILKVSTRTIDRYMRKYRCKTRKDGRRVLIKRTDIDKIIKNNISKLINIDEKNLNNIMQNEDKNSSAITVNDIKVKNIKKESNQKDIEEQIYKELYHDVKNDLKEKQERLEVATYRVGQLETQLKNMVPLLEYNKKDNEVKEIYNAIDLKAREYESTKSKMETRIRSEKIAKYIYLSLVGALLVAEPILFLIWAF